MQARAELHQHFSTDLLCVDQIICRSSPCAQTVVAGVEDQAVALPLDGRDIMGLVAVKNVRFTARVEHKGAASGCMRQRLASRVLVPVAEQASCVLP